MYSLPITTYSDYWRRTKKWSSYLGGLAVFAAGTRYSTLEVSDFPQTIQLLSQQTTQSLSTQKLDTEELSTKIYSLDFRERTSNQWLAGRKLPNERMVSRGVNSLGPTNQEVSSQGGVVQEEVIQEDGTQDSSTQGFLDVGTGDKTPTIHIQVLEKEIPFETQYVESDDLLPGMKQTQEKGEEGVLRQVIKTFEVDGQPVDQQVASSYELKSPKKEVIIQNSKPVPKKKIIVQTPKPGNADDEIFDLTNLKISKTLNVEATAYTYTGNNTATGVKPREGLIAVDPRVIAMGSKVYVEGYGYAIAADTGGAIQGNRIDVFFGTLRQCIDWGRKPVRIHIISPT